MANPTRAKLIGIILLVALVIVLAIYHPFGEQNLDSVRAWIASQGAAAGLIYIAVYVIACVLCLPGSLLTLIAGPLFGLGLGILYVVIGSNVGANACFLLARFLGRDFAKKMVGARWQEKLEGNKPVGLWWVFGLRLIPAIPFNLLNYAAGLTPVRLRDHALGSLLGMLPGTVMYVSLGTAASRVRLSDPASWATPEFLLSLGLAVGLGLSLWAIVKFRK